MFGILGLGLLLGMQHALEADHIAAVSSIAARRSHVADIVKHGLTWGLGHTLTLFFFAGAAILLGHAIPESVARPIETAVGVMLVGLGGHVLWRVWRDRAPFHQHRPGVGGLQCLHDGLACRVQPDVPVLVNHVTLWVPMLVLPISVNFHELFQDR